MNDNRKKVDLLHKNKCVLCKSCIQSCRVGAITISLGKDGFYCPKVESTKCIQCNICKENCPITNKDYKNSKNLNIVYSGWSKNIKTQRKSSSGGVFSEISETIINDNGVVFGASYNDDFKVRHVGITKKEEIDKIRGSKYVQSDITNTYIEARKYLDEGRIVLFSGTPCQIAGLKTFLHNKDYNNLITVDVVCHGVPSQSSFMKYINNLKKRYGSEIKSINFRYKKDGWENYKIKIEFINGQTYIKDFYKDNYFTAFLRNWNLRESCYNCEFKNHSKVSDITLGDFWGIKEIDQTQFNKDGVSYISINTKRGLELINRVSNKLVLKKMDIENYEKYNPAIYNSMKLTKERKIFLYLLRTTNINIATKITSGMFMIKIIMRKLKLIKGEL